MVKKPVKVKDELMEHDFDGIQELDNELPPWWLWLFYITIFWGLGYLVYYHVLQVGDSSKEQYLKEMALAAEMQRQTPGGGMAGAAVAGQEGEAAEVAALKDEQSLAQGKEIYQKNCTPCHAPDGGGTVGPNLTDEYWIHGARTGDVVNTIVNGVPVKGMISWAPILKPDEILQVASYVISLRGTTPASPKAPEGQKVDYSGIN